MTTPSSPIVKPVAPEAVKAIVPESVVPPVKEVIPTKKEIIDELVKDQDSLADWLIGSRRKREE